MGKEILKNIYNISSVISENLFTENTLFRGQYGLSNKPKEIYM